MRIDKIAQMVEAFQHLYNHHRPHGALAGKTPAGYLSIRRANETPQTKKKLSQARAVLAGLTS